MVELHQIKQDGAAERFGLRRDVRKDVLENRRAGQFADGEAAVRAKVSDLRITRTSAAVLLVRVKSLFTHLLYVFVRPWTVCHQLACWLPQRVRLGDGGIREVGVLCTATVSRLSLERKKRAAHSSTGSPCRFGSRPARDRARTGPRHDRSPAERRGSPTSDRAGKRRRCGGSIRPWHRPKPAQEVAVRSASVRPVAKAVGLSIVTHPS